MLLHLLKQLVALFLLALGFVLQRPERLLELSEIDRPTAVPIKSVKPLVDVFVVEVEPKLFAQPLRVAGRGKAVTPPPQCSGAADQGGRLKTRVGHPSSWLGAHLPELDPRDCTLPAAIPIA